MARNSRSTITRRESSAPTRRHATRYARRVLAGLPAVAIREVS